MVALPETKLNLQQSFDRCGHRPEGARFELGVHYWRGPEGDAVHSEFITSGSIELAPPELTITVADLPGAAADNSNLEV